jgi:K+-transporting ATPase ATPase C chain
MRTSTPTVRLDREASSSGQTPRSLLQRQLRPALLVTLVLCVLTGIIYPGIVTGLAQLLFRRQANGSLLAVNGRVVGSVLIAQPFGRPEYFHPRPSGAGSGYDATASSGTNKGPTDRKLADTLIEGAIAQAVAADSAVRGRIPSDLVTSSGSGLDPDLSPAGALLQVPRVARARSASPAAVQALVEQHVQGRQFGFFGERRVNVLRLNVALDSLFPLRAR